MTDTYDVIIAGGGGAGCILAARLSEDPECSVLVLEAGPDFVARENCPEPVRDERFVPVDFLWNYDGLRTVEDESPIVVVRGKVLGGSTSVNTLIYQRGMAADYDGWGSELWTNDALRPYFEKIECDLDFGDGRSDGVLPLRRTPFEDCPPSAQAFLRGAEEIGFSVVKDFLPNTEEGVGPVARNCEDGTRISTALAYLVPARHRPNLTVQGDTLVSRVLFDDGRAKGVEIIRNGRSEPISANQVILCAGAIGSPHLLTLSGIGPPEALERLGIPVVAERPGVGRNLSDHPVIPVLVRLKDGVESGEARILNMMTFTAPGSETPHDIFMALASGDFSGGVWAGRETPAVEAGIFCTLNLADSLGEIETVSTDPADLPRVHFHYLGSERDRARLREGARIAVRIFESSEFAPLVAERMAPSAEQLESNEMMDEWIHSALATALHGSGTCKMGPTGDPMAVVDYEGRVHGVEGLRVVDLSIAPTTVRSPTAATAMVIAERVADLIRDEQKTAIGLVAGPDAVSDSPLR
jgi:choline dehydrogenase